VALFKSPEEREVARVAKEEARREAEERAAIARAEEERVEAERRRLERAHVATLERYQYLVHDVGSGDMATTERGARDLEGSLNDLARSGWRVITTIRLEREVTQTSTYVTTRFILERPAPRG
jgi:hypothetical protein